MKILATATDLNRELMRLLRECDSCQVAVAWASVGFKAFELLTKHEDKIARMIVGTHFYQTHPDFIEQFLGHANVRFVFHPDSLFHPKVYLFEKPGNEWECAIAATTPAAATRQRRTGASMPSAVVGCVPHILPSTWCQSTLSVSGY
jgi:HKD family nuclease